MKSFQQNHFIHFGMVIDWPSVFVYLAVAGNALQADVRRRLVFEQPIQTATSGPFNWPALSAFIDPFSGPHTEVN